MEIEDRIYELQYFTGYRIPEEENPSFSSPEEVAPWFAQKIQETKDFDRTKGIKLYHVLEKETEKITGKTPAPDQDLNDLLNKEQKKQLYKTVEEEHHIKLAPLTLPPALVKLLGLLSGGGIFGGLLFSTYAVFMLNWSGWIFLTPLFFLILSLISIQALSGTKSYIAQKNTVELAQASCVIEKKNTGDHLHLNEAQTLEIINHYLKYN